MGNLLGDAYRSKRSKKGTRICYRQSDIHKDYLFSIHNKLRAQGYTTILIPRLYRRTLKNGNVYHGYEFNTITFTSLDFLHELFYKNNIKYINSDIQKYLTPLALAYWFIDDGGWVSTSKSIRISTVSFTKPEVVILADMLKQKFDLDFTVQKLSHKNKTINQYNLYLLRKDFFKFKTLVLPYMHKSILYKLG